MAVWDQMNQIKWRHRHAVQGGCRVFPLGDVQKLPGCGAGQPLGVPAQVGGWTRWPLEVPANLRHSVIISWPWPPPKRGGFTPAPLLCMWALELKVSAVIL